MRGSSPTRHSADKGVQTTFTAQDKDAGASRATGIGLPACVPAVAMTVRPALLPDIEALGSWRSTRDTRAEPLHAWYDMPRTRLSRRPHGTGWDGGGLYASAQGGTYSLVPGRGKSLRIRHGTDQRQRQRRHRMRDPEPPRQWRPAPTADEHALAEYCITNCVFPLHEEGVWHRLTALCFDSPLVTNELFQKGGPVTADISVPADGCVRLLRPIPPGGTLLLRWVDVDDTGNDHALGIDHVNVAWTAGDMPAGILVPTNGITETFDEMGEHAADILPWSWRTKTSDSVRTTGAYADAETTVTHDNAAPGSRPPAATTSRQTAAATKRSAAHG